MPTHYRPARAIELACPHPDAGDAEYGCRGTVAVPAEWEPGEWYGADADGHRAVWRAGYWTVGAVPARCTHGCALDDDQVTDLRRAADRAAED